MGRRLTRRRFLAVSGEASLAAAGLWAAEGQATADPPAADAAADTTDSAAGAPAVRRVDDLPAAVTRTWLGPQYWANRLQDWRLHRGRIESLRTASGGRTVGVLTRSLRAGDLAGALEVRTGTLATGTGSGGFLVGAGAGRLDWRAAALVMAASGQGGGFLAVYDSDGHVRFRDHSAETSQFAYVPLAATDRRGPAPERRVGEDVTLRLDVLPAGPGRFDLRLTARTTSGGTLLSTATRRGVPDADLLGGISLISTSREGGTRVRHWFQHLATGGRKVAEHARGAGPVLATQYSLSAGVLKLSAQLMPIGPREPQTVVLQARRKGSGVWRTVQEAPVRQGWCALFRVPDWDSSQAWDYRVGWAVGRPQEAWYGGTVRAEPRPGEQLGIAMVNCTIHAPRNLDIPSRSRERVPGARPLGLYTTDNLYFPYATVVAGIRRARPDLLVAFGDQYYEYKPTEKDLREPLLDVVGRYCLWLWSFGELTRSTPSIILVDDHDVYHGNIWGWAGRPAPGADPELGGYAMPADWVNTVQQMQCAHDPDPYRPDPVEQQIGVYYTAFSYGGVSFAVLEDRKWKNTTKLGTDENGQPLTGPRQLLGKRQEAFLQAWSSMHPGQPKVCLTQTLFACVQTDEQGRARADTDANASPVTGRRTALRLLRQAGALVLSGDQHMGSLVRHGLDTHTDGPVQFTAPAAGTAWQRWFRPAARLPHATGPDTGDFTDAYGNRLRVLAVVNPRVEQPVVRSAHPHNNVGDRRLKREGYGVVVVDPAQRRHRIHCWAWDARPGEGEYAGFPYDLPFSRL